MGNPLKKTMVYLGLADEEEAYEEQAAPAPARAHRDRDRDRDQDDVAPAPVTPLRRPVAVKQPAAGAVNEILTVHPKQYRDAQLIAESFREGVPVIINLSQMSDADARRLIDFASGLSLGLYGRIERVTSKVFLLSPENIAVSGHGGIASADPESAGFDQS
ncbi:MULTISPECIES: cell division protein SepF [unclassified Microbacterium]|uniref:cell division protein SepF n=1 Tax=unclassified Microbacterium TaxID=2609290 RepID=UPI001D6D1777|nr:MULTISPECIES: cell division protein SepF [unclassified Microbacterium]CAH0169092.1 Cell division protein SepF [Microbacterium sp. Bi121]HWK77971.1 cell division protein SepF [Microbacterium sp.]